jgi:hypothetical protein
LRHTPTVKREETKITEQELRGQLGELIKGDLNFIEVNKNLGFNSTDEAIDIVLKYDATISDVSAELGVPKALIQAVLFKELRMKDIRDVAADSMVSEYYRYMNGLVMYSELSLWQKMVIGPPQPGLMNEDSSTGLGQIFASTAIEAHNAGIKRGDMRGELIDYNDWRQREKTWNDLRDEKTNILYVGLVLKHKAEKLNEDEGLQIKELTSATDYQLERIHARYNGFGDKAAEYGKETKHYHDIFAQYNN